MPDYPLQNRRIGPDFLVKTIQVTGILCWSLFIVSLLLVDKAKPRIETFFDRLLGVQLHQNWDHKLLQANFYVVFAIFLLSSAGLLFNKMRARRKTDRISRTLIFLSVLSFSALIFSLLFNHRSFFLF